MDFIREIHESKMIRGESDVKQLTYTDCCERSYLLMLTLQLLSQFPKHKKSVNEYVRKTVQGNFKSFRVGSTDLHNFLYFVYGDDDDLNKLKDPAAAKELRKRVTLNINDIERYLNSLRSGRSVRSLTDLFINIEKSFKIDNISYRAIRRSVTDVKDISNISLKDSVTKLLYALRAKLRSSDLIDDLEDLAAQKDLESEFTADTEPTVSVPDPIIKNTDLIYLAKLVGTSNLFLALKFIELAKRQDPIPPSLVKSFLPAIDIIVDIVKGGPAYITMLENIRDKAKRSKR